MGIEMPVGAAIAVRLAFSIPHDPEETGRERIEMSQLSSSTPATRPALGASFMFLGSLALAGTNILQSVLPWSFGMSSTGMAFWQYLIATLFALPLILRIGLGNLRTRHPFAHEIRAFVSALGIHVFVYGFAAGVPIWQMITLLSTGPLFIIAGTTLFLGERVSLARLVAALVGFAHRARLAGNGNRRAAPWCRRARGRSQRPSCCRRSWRSRRGQQPRAREDRRAPAGGKRMLSLAVLWPSVTGAVRMRQF